jgi:hypothetical protein
MITGCGAALDLQVEYEKLSPFTKLRGTLHNNLLAISGVCVNCVNSVHLH